MSQRTSISGLQISRAPFTKARLSPSLKTRITRLRNQLPTPLNPSPGFAFLVNFMGRNVFLPPILPFTGISNDTICQFTLVVFTIFHAMLYFGSNDNGTGPKLQLHIADHRLRPPRVRRPEAKFLPEYRSHPICHQPSAVGTDRVTVSCYNFSCLFAFLADSEPAGVCRIVTSSFAMAAGMANM